MAAPRPFTSSVVAAWLLPRRVEGSREPEATPVEAGCGGELRRRHDGDSDVLARLHLVDEQAADVNWFDGLIVDEGGAALIARMRAC